MRSLYLLLFCIGCSSEKADLPISVVKPVKEGDALVFSWNLDGYDSLKIDNNAFYTSGHTQYYPIGATAFSIKAYRGKKVVYERNIKIDLKDGEKLADIKIIDTAPTTHFSPGMIGISLCASQAPLLMGNPAVEKNIIYRHLIQQLAGPNHFFTIRITSNPSDIKKIPDATLMNALSVFYADMKQKNLAVRYILPLDFSLKDTTLAFQQAAYYYSNLPKDAILAFEPLPAATISHHTAFSNFEAFTIFFAEWIKMIRKATYSEMKFEIAWNEFFDKGNNIVVFKERFAKDIYSLSLPEYFIRPLLSDEVAGVRNALKDLQHKAGEISLALTDLVLIDTAISENPETLYQQALNGFDKLLYLLQSGVSRFDIDGDNRDKSSNQLFSMHIPEDQYLKSAEIYAAGGNARQQYELRKVYPLYYMLWQLRDLIEEAVALQPVDVESEYRISAYRFITKEGKSKYIVINREPDKSGRIFIRDTTIVRAWVTRVLAGSSDYADVSYAGKTIDTRSDGRSGGEMNIEKMLVRKLGVRVAMPALSVMLVQGKF